MTGTWKPFKYIATNFDTSGGKTALPSDTIYPVHAESVRYTDDTIYSDVWETDVYYFTHPDSFVNTQNKEFVDTFAYSSTASYLVEKSHSAYDTVFIVSLSDTVMVTKDDIYNSFNPPQGHVYDLYSYLRKE